MVFEQKSQEGPGLLSISPASRRVSAMMIIGSEYNRGPGLRSISPARRRTAFLPLDGLFSISDVGVVPSSDVCCCWCCRIRLGLDMMTDLTMSLDKNPYVFL